MHLNMYIWENYKGSIERAEISSFNQSAQYCLMLLIDHLQIHTPNIAVEDLYINWHFMALHWERSRESRAALGLWYYTSNTLEDHLRIYLYLDTKVTEFA